jgi:hypothetical protein
VENVETLTGRKRHCVETLAGRRALLCGRPSVCAERYYVETFTLRRAPVDPDPHSGQPSLLCEDGPALPNENWVRFVIGGGGRLLVPAVALPF